MKQRRRIYHTDSQKALMWERWRKVESLQQIAQLFDRNHSSVQRILAERGGIQPRQRRRSSLALTLAEQRRCMSEIRKDARRGGDVAPFSRGRICIFHSRLPSPRADNS